MDLDIATIVVSVIGGTAGIWGFLTARRASKTEDRRTAASAETEGRRIDATTEAQRTADWNTFCNRITERTDKLQALVDSQGAEIMALRAELAGVKADLVIAIRERDLATQRTRDLERRVLELETELAGWQAAYVIQPRSIL